MIWHVDLNARISAFVAKDLSISRRRHVRNDEEAGLPWWAWGRGPVAADARFVVGDNDVQMIVAA